MFGDGPPFDPLQRDLIDSRGFGGNVEAVAVQLRPQARAQQRVSIDKPYDSLFHQCPPHRVLFFLIELNAREPIADWQAIHPSG